MVSVGGWLSTRHFKGKNWTRPFRSYGVMDPNEKILVQTLVSMYRESQERGTTVSIY